MICKYPFSLALPVLITHLFLLLRFIQLHVDVDVFTVSLGPCNVSHTPDTSSGRRRAGPCRRTGWGGAWEGRTGVGHGRSPLAAHCHCPQRPIHGCRSCGAPSVDTYPYLVKVAKHFITNNNTTRK